MEFDVRSDYDTIIYKIVFAEKESDRSKLIMHEILESSYQTDCITLNGYGRNSIAHIRKSDVSNLIKALQKAQQLGWDK